MAAAAEPLAAGAGPAWVVGSGGLLGKGVVRELRRRGTNPLTSRVPWEDPVASGEVLANDAARMLADGRPWRLFWCAGAGVIGTSQAELDQEVAVFTAFTDHLTELLARPGAAPGAIFLASSGGGVHAGSPAPPFTETTTVRPISPYGDAKLAIEQALERLGTTTALPTFTGRIANLYGPGQNISKPQGLISQLCRAYLAREPLSIYVSLDTARDYLYVDDAATMIIQGLDRAARYGGQHLKILASQRSISIAGILAELGRVTRRRPQVVLGSSGSARYQAKDIRFRSVVWTDLDDSTRTTLASGIGATLESLRRDQLAGVLTDRRPR